MLKDRNGHLGPDWESWPDIVTYLTRDGIHHDFPPLSGVPYRIAVHDLGRYDALVSSGALYRIGHRQCREAMVDLRRAPQ